MGLVEVYRNLHTNTWSVRDAKLRLVIDHPTKVLLKNVKFVVSEAGRSRVLQQRRKNVHAVVRGELVHLPATSPVSPAWLEVVYNPYKYSTFVFKSGEQPIFQASDCWMEMQELAGKVTGKLWVSM